MDKEFIFCECIFQTNDLVIFKKLNKIAFDFYTFNKILFSSIGLNDIDDFVQNLNNENIRDNFYKIQEKMNIFNFKKMKIITTNIEEYRQIIMIFLIFRNSIFKSAEDLKREFIKYFQNNIIIYDIKDKKKIPIILSDYYLSIEQRNFIKNLENIEIILNK